jgi:uncharacterized protein
MKYLVLLLVVWAGVWWIRQQRLNSMAQDATQPNPNTPQTMLPCKHCGIHVPEGDAVHGVSGSYCSASHRQAAEG